LGVGGWEFGGWGLGFKIGFGIHTLLFETGNVNACTIDVIGGVGVDVVGIFSIIVNILLIITIITIIIINIIIIIIINNTIEIDSITIFISTTTTTIIPPPPPTPQTCNSVTLFTSLIP